MVYIEIIANLIANVPFLYLVPGIDHQILKLAYLIIMNFFLCKEEVKKKLIIVGEVNYDFRKSSPDTFT